MEFFCPFCGLVVEAGIVRGLGLMKAHTAKEHGRGFTYNETVPPSVRDAIDEAAATAGAPCPYNTQPLRLTLASLDDGTLTRRWSEWPWKDCLTVADAEFLASLQIDPS